MIIMQSNYRNFDYLFKFGVSDRTGRLVYKTKTLSTWSIHKPNTDIFGSFKLELIK